MCLAEKQSFVVFVVVVVVFCVSIIISSPGNIDPVRLQNLFDLNQISDKVRYDKRKG